MIIAMDGPAGTGKSTIARMVAKHLHFTYLNSGNLYRAITYGCLASSIDLDNADAVVEFAKTVRLEYRQGRVALENRDIEDELHTDAIDGTVAQVSAIVPVRHVVNDIIRAAAGSIDAVVEGRDITTVVFPDADLKFYLDASVDSRTCRRFAQGTSKLSFDEVRANIEMRDSIDRSKAEGSLKIASDAVYLDTSDLTIEEVYEKVYAKIHHQGTNMGIQEVEVNAVKKPSSDSIQTQLQEEYLKSIDQLEEGDLVDGHVIQVTNDTVFIDVGAKSEGKIPLVEFAVAPKVGDQVSVVLLKKETYSGDIVVSKKRADEKIHWRTFSSAFHEHLPVEGTIDKEIKGGFEVNLNHGLRGFLPVSKADVHRVEKTDKLIGLTSLFFIERLYSEKRVNIVLNRRKWLEEHSEKQRDEFFAKAQIGDVVKGSVKSFTSFGAFIDLGGFDGLLHINDMSWGHVTRPKDFVKKGQEIELKVIRLDAEEKRINLSLKHFTDDPWLTFEERYHIGDVVQGKVTKLTDYGAFIEVEEGIEGLAHISEFSWIRKVRKPEEMLKIDDPVQCMILNYDLQAGKVSLGLKQVQENPWDNVDNKYPVGMRLKRKVVKITNAGAFIELEEGVDGFLHVDDLSWTKKVKNPASELEAGQEIEVIVIESDQQDHNVRLGVKQLSEDPWKSFAKAFHVGSIVDGIVSGVTDFGVFVKVQGDIEGLVNKMNITVEREDSFENVVKNHPIGSPIRSMVTELSVERQRLSLSIRDMVRRTQREELSKFMQDESDSSEGYTLGDILKDKDDSGDNA
ncbi:MAG: 30S ribosomal protein S1 [Spirochaetes bacterium]|nr:30S ribosomal protein S1 [Spirochaetota bacterium]